MPNRFGLGFGLLSSVATIDIFFRVVVLLVFIFVLVLFLDHTRVLAPIHLTNRRVLVILLFQSLFALFCALHYRLQGDTHVTGKVHKAHRELGRHLFMNLFLIQLLQILNKMFLEFIQACLYLLLLPTHYGWVHQILNFHVCY